MGPKKRRRRFISALSAAILLAGALAYTSFSASSEARTPGELATGAVPGRVYEVTGVVLPGYRRQGEELRFRVRDRAGRGAIAVRYRGTVPDPFRVGREVVVDVRRQGAAFVGVPDSLITKCPSKFSATQPA